MDSATRGGVLGYGGFALIGAAARAVQARAMSTSRSRQRLGDLSNDATVDKGLGLIDRGGCRIRGGGAALGAAVAIGQGLSQVGALAAGSGARLVRVNLLPRSAGAGASLSRDTSRRFAGDVLQTGGNTLQKRTAQRLNEVLGESLSPREWGRLLERLKSDLGLPNDHHGRILSNGVYVDDAGRSLGNLTDYL